MRRLLHLLALQVPDPDTEIHLGLICPMVQQGNTNEVSLEIIFLIEECLDALKY